MGVFYEPIPKSLFEWILAQKIFWVATAPLSASGHVNLSPKGGSYFGVIDERTFWYMELTGSGIETVSHLHERGNGRITVLFNAFEGGPRIVRLWGKGRVLENHSPQFEDFISQHSVKTIPGTRSIVIVDIHQVGTSCGFSVPFYDFVGFRPTLNDHFRKMDERYRAGNKKESMDRYWAYKNAWSMDGLPGLKRGVEAGRREKVEPIRKMVGALAPPNGKLKFKSGVPIEWVVVIAVLSFVLGALMIIYSGERRFGGEKGGVGMRGWVNATGLVIRVCRWPQGLGDDEEDASRSFVLEGLA